MSEPRSRPRTENFTAVRRAFSSRQICEKPCRTPTDASAPSVRRCPVAPNTGSWRIASKSATAFGATYDAAYDWTSQCLKTPEAIRDLEPPRLGDGTEKVLSEELGLDAEEIARLRKDGVIG